MSPQDRLIAACVAAWDAQLDVNEGDVPPELVYPLSLVAQALTKIVPDWMTSVLNERGVWS